MSIIAKFNRADPARRVDSAPISSIAIVLLGLRLFLAVGWMRAAAEKVIDSRWWDGLILDNFLRAQRSQALPFFRPIIDHLISPRLVVVSVVVVVAQIVCSLLILTGKWLRPALIAAVVMNLTFMFAGRVNPSAFYLMMEFTLLIAIADGVIGPTGRRSTNWLASRAVILIIAAVALTPFAETIDPSEVILDPALVLAAVLAIAGTVFGLLARVGRDDSQAQRQHSPRFISWITAGRDRPSELVAIATTEAADAPGWLPPTHDPLPQPRSSTPVPVAPFVAPVHVEVPPNEGLPPPDVSARARAQP